MSKEMARWQTGRTSPWWALRVSHESAGLHVTGTALYTRTWSADARHAARLAGPGSATRTRGSPACARTRPYGVPGVVRVLTAQDVPGLNDAGEKHDEPLFPGEVMFYGHAVCWVRARRWRRPGRAPTRSRPSTSRCPR